MVLKKLDWNTISDFLQTELKESKHIMTWGTIGSLNIKHDIDTIITKKPNSPSADFFKEVHNIFENLDFYLHKNFKTRAVRFAQATQKCLVEEYTKGKKVMFHTMIYISFPQIQKDWGWALFKDENISEILKENYVCLMEMSKVCSQKIFKQKTILKMYLFISIYMII